MKKKYALMLWAFYFYVPLLHAKGPGDYECNPNSRASDVAQAGSIKMESDIELKVTCRASTAHGKQKLVVLTQYAIIKKVPRWCGCLGSKSVVEHKNEPKCTYYDNQYTTGFETTGQSAQDLAVLVKRRFLEQSVLAFVERQ